MKNASPCRRSQTGFRPSFELLETRLTPSTFDVANLNDSGMGSLRQAIMDANSSNGADVIDFSVAGTIQLTSGALPAVRDQVTIDGTSAPNFANVPLVEIDNKGFAGLTLNAPNSSLAGLSIVNANGAGVTLEGNSITVVGNYIGLALDGSLAANQGNGIVVSSSGDTIGGTAAGAGNVISGNSLNGILVENPTTNGTVIQGNFIGTNATGLVDLGNGGAGISIDTGSSNNTIGGTTTAQRNVISGNGFGPFGPGAGITISGVVGGNLPDQANKNIVEGNFIGVDVSGGTALGNCLAGVAMLDGTDSNTIGGTAAGAGNVISGNSGTVGSGIFGDGVLLNDTLGNMVLGNRIGVDVTGLVAVPNAGDGVDLYQEADNNSIGAPGAGNIISGNGQSGILIQDFSSISNLIRGNSIGVDAAGTTALANQRYGVEIAGGEFNQIGGMVAGAGNVISGNLAGGVSINALFSPPRFGSPTQGFSGALPAGTYFYIITATTAAGETTASAERTITLSAPGAVVLSWVASGSANSGVTGYKIYRGTFAGAENVLVAEVAGVAMTSFTDAGGTTTLGSPPQTNTALSIDGASRNTVQGNTIGLNSAGTAAIPNLIGVLIVDATQSSIGLNLQGTGNVISGNLSDGIRISGGSAKATGVQGNFIGTASDGNTPLPNGGNGIDIEQGASTSGVNSSNVIQGNAQDGVLVQTGSIGNTIVGNSIFNNGNLGIELQPRANQNQPAPVILPAFIVQGNTLIYGQATGAPNSSLTACLYASPSTPSTGPGQGQTFLDEFAVGTNAAGQADFSATISGSGLAGQFLTATATDQQGNTSEFSAGVAVTSNPLASVTIVMYQDVLNRPPSVSDINFWTAQLSSGVSRFVMAQVVWESAEHRTIEVHQYFEQYLDRAPDPAAQTYWVSQMLAGLSETAIQVDLLTSPEYAQNPFNPELDHLTITDYVTGLYNDVFNRVPAPAEVQVWVGAAAAGATRAQIAAVFLTSPEEYQDLLNTYYSEYLERQPDAAGAAFFLNALASGSATPESVAETILASDEFFALASGS